MNQGSQTSSRDSQASQETGPNIDKSIPFLKSKQLLQNDTLKMHIEKIGFQTQKKFKLEDHHFVMKVETLSNTVPLMKDILQQLEDSIFKVIDELKKYYSKNIFLTKCLVLMQTSFLHSSLMLL